MLILALDTTLAACSAALIDTSDGRVLGQMQEPMQQGHAERLADMTREIANGANVDFDQLDRIAVTTGPGTFTGVRIGLALARGIGRALDIPVTGVSTLRAIAANVDDNPDQLPISVMMDARRSAFYTQTFSHTYEALSEPQCVLLAELKHHLTDEARIIVGSGADLITDRPAGWQISSASTLPNAVVVARLSASQAECTAPPAPLYLRPADAKPQAAQIKLARMGVTVLPADAGFAAVLAGIHGECFPAGWSAADLSTMLESPGMIALVAVTEGGNDEPAGFILCRQAADEAEIITLCVRPNMRRRGIAAQLLGPAIDQAKSAGAAKMFLEVRADNIAAKALYSSAGLAEVGSRPGYYTLQDGSRADATIMALDLVS
ncbi:MAG: tRNA (adenosine(37)-N6)-threonylcarbamoyltransferase complex dimerization subunit type 1 TsaB [Hyphomicrobiales bacterium]|nr:tRNA (adenosine(37)-N6)-threonylcarbamoyltransferase complex dimerization subunit type 1 TsaB [Hyphomicrobiales bacterium]